MSSPLICKEVYYYSQLDEDMFFAWLDRIPCIDRYEGKGDSLYVYLKDKAFQNKENEIDFRSWAKEMDMKGGLKAPPL